MRRRYAAARNVGFEQPAFGVWDKDDAVWLVEHVGTHWWDAQEVANEAEFGRMWATDAETDWDDQWNLIAGILNDYYPDLPIGELACIRASEDWKYIEARADVYSGAQFESGPGTYREGLDFAVTALYECHGGPHIEPCPYYITRETHDRDHVHKRYDCDFCEEEQRDAA